MKKKIGIKIVGAILGSFLAVDMVWAASQTMTSYYPGVKDPDRINGQKATIGPTNTYGRGAINDSSIPVGTFLVAGPVGIGMTVAPSTKLVIEDNSTGVFRGLTLAQTSPNDNLGATLNLVKQPTNADGAIQASVVGDGIGQIVYRFYNAVKTQKEGAAIQSQVIEAAAGAEAADLEFSTAQAGALTERMRIVPAGEIGIGTTTPEAGTKLTVQGPSAGNPYLFNVGGTGNGRMKVRHIDGKDFGSGNVDHLYLQYGINKNTIINGGNSAGRVGLGTDLLDPNPNMRITVDQSMGVFNPTSQAVLAITGPGELTGAYRRTDSAIYLNDATNNSPPKNSWVLSHKNLIGSPVASEQLEQNAFEVSYWDPLSQRTVALYIQPPGAPGNPTLYPRTRFFGDVYATGVFRDSSFISDLRFKTDVKPLTNMLGKLDRIHGVSFQWNDLYKSRLGYTPSEHKEEIGVVAQEVESVFPELVVTMDEKGYKGVNYMKLTPILIEAVKELKAENDTLKKRIEILEKKRK